LIQDYLVAAVLLCYIALGVQELAPIAELTDTFFAELFANFGLEI
jgi:hypothetical protein